MSDQTKGALIDRLKALLPLEPRDKNQLLGLLHAALRRNLLDGDALSMIEGVLQVSEMQVRDIMVPRAQMDVIDVHETPDKFIPQVIATAHSRFPVIDRNRDDIIGILLAKDLLRYYAGEEEFSVRDMLRPAVFVPESKPLNVLLREFRASRNHMAIVVDEYGGAAGLVTIEDVIEQIVGDIEDEYDLDETEDNIVQESSNRWRIKGQTEIAAFNQAFSLAVPDEDFDTVGGLVLHRFGRLPKRGESLTVEGLRLTVSRADSRRVHLLSVQKLPGKA